LKIQQVGPSKPKIKHTHLSPTFVENITIRYDQTTRKSVGLRLGIFYSLCADDFPTCTKS
jgi:hypothetical protein